MPNRHEPNIVRVFDSNEDCPLLAILEGKGTAKAVLWPGNGAKYRTVHLLEMKAGDKTIDLSHQSDAVYYVAAGKGNVVDVARDSSSELEEGSMIHIDGGDTYRLQATSDFTVIGGPCPADFSLYSHFKNGSDE